MFVSNNYGPAIRLQVLVLLWAPLIENRGIRAAALRIVLRAFAELLRFLLRTSPNIFTRLAEAALRKFRRVRTLTYHTATAVPNGIGRATFLFSLCVA